MGLLEGPVDQAATGVSNREVQKDMDRGNLFNVVITDFGKVFKTLDRFIMQLKLQGTGLANDSADWIKCSLTIQSNLLK